jgi:serine/threonine protein kinase
MFILSNKRILTWGCKGAVRLRDLRRLGRECVITELPMVGDEFVGYRLRAVLGRGGMSVVYQAENPRLGSVIALKVLAPELAHDDVFRARFLGESRIAASLNHPNVIPVYDMGSATACCISPCGMARGPTCGR